MTEEDSGDERGKAGRCPGDKKLVSRSNIKSTKAVCMGNASEMERKWIIP